MTIENGKMSGYVKDWVESELFQKDIIATRKTLVDICDGKHVDAIFLSQLLYWSHPSRIRVKKQGVYWVAKRYSDWEDETCITERQAREIVNRLVEKEFVYKETYKFNGRNTVHLRINYEALETALYDEIKTTNLSPSKRSKRQNLSNSSTENTKDNIHRTVPKEKLERKVGVKRPTSSLVPNGNSVTYPKNKATKEKISKQYSHILSKLENCRSSGYGWSAKCPCHNDNRNSLSLQYGDDGRLLIKCHAGCMFSDVITSMGIHERDLFPEHRKSYIYTDSANKPLFKVTRTANKKFWTQRLEGEHWINGLDNTQRVIYNLPGVLEAKRCAEPIYIVEGEKDAQRLIDEGFTATTNMGGAGSWDSRYNEFFQGAEVIIIPDKDEPGYKHALTVAEALSYVAKSVSFGIVQSGKDVSDHFDAGRTLKDIDIISKKKLVDSLRISMGAVST